MGLDPATQCQRSGNQKSRMGARVKPAHDESEILHPTQIGAAHVRIVDQLASAALEHQ